MAEPVKTISRFQSIRPRRPRATIPSRSPTPQMSFGFIQGLSNRRRRRACALSARVFEAGDGNDRVWGGMGRDTIISGGVNIYPREVEDVLVTHPAVQDAAVFGVPNEEFGEEVKAAVELVPGGSASAQELIDFCRARIAHLKCPRSVDFHPELPRHQTGKLYKGILKRPYWNS